MGYRSEVKAVFYTCDKEQWPALRLFVDENFPEEFKYCLGVIGSSSYCGYVFSCEDVRWYDGYPDVQAYKKFVAQYTELVENAEDGHELPWVYEFIRIGEDTEDIETEGAGNCDYVLQVKRSIECEF